MSRHNGLTTVERTLLDRMGNFGVEKMVVYRYQGKSRPMVSFTFEKAGKEPLFINLPFRFYRKYFYGEDCALEELQFHAALHFEEY